MKDNQSNCLEVGYKVATKRKYGGWDEVVTLSNIDHPDDSILHPIFMVGNCSTR